MNDQTIRELDEAIRLNPEDAKAYINRADAYDRKGEHDLAITDYTKAIKIYSKDPKVYTKRGFIYVKKGKYNLAIADYSEAIRLDPKYVEAYRAREDVYLVKREYDLAFADYDEIIRLSRTSENTEIVNDKRRRRLDIDWGAIADYTETIWWEIRDLDKTIRRNPQDAMAYNNRGDIYSEKLHNLDEAFKDYNEAIRLKPDYATAYKNRGELFQDIGVYDLAIADYSRAIKFASDETDYYVELMYIYRERGLMYIYEGAYDRAIADYNEAIKHQGKLKYSIDASLYFRRGYAYYKKGNSDKAITDLNEAFQRGFSNHAMIYLYRGSMYFAIGNYDQALEDYDNVVRLCPNYKIDFLDDNFKKFGGQREAAKATKLLDSVSDNYYQSGNEDAAAYYSGVSILFSGNPHIARENFETARKLGFDDNDKVIKHLENLKSRF